MADIRTLKLALLADTKDFIDGLDKANREAKTFTNKLDDALFGATKAFLAVGAAAGAMAIKIGVDAVKAAIEDEKAQLSLAQTLRNTVKATDAQIKATEEYIDKTARATGIADDQLRPSLDRLIRSTNDLTKAQKLQQLALDISAGTGKDLATVTEALGKAYDGNLGALKRIGVPLDENIIKTKDFDAAVKVLSETFAGQADIAANSFAGRMARIKISIDEAKETLGQALLPILEKFAKFATDILVPALEDFVAGLTGGQPNSVKNAVKDVKGRIVEFNDGLEKTANTGAYGLGVALQQLGQTISDLNKTAFGVSGADSGLKQLLDLLTKITNAIEDAIGAYQRLPDVGKLLVNPVGQLAPLVPAAGNLVSSTKQQVVNIYNNVKGAIDPQSTARAISKVTNTAYATTGLRAFNY